MDEQAVRDLVRAVVGRRLGPGPGEEPIRPLTPGSHPSHYRYTLPESGGPCLIEPGVACVHCGYCQSHGH